jgi:hypothetical protein
MFLYLGLGVSRVNDMPPGVETVRALAQLFEEWEYHFGGTAMQSVKFVMAKNSLCSYPQLQPKSTGQADSPEYIKPTLYKYNNDVVYEILQTPHMPFELDYAEVLVALCEALCNTYSQLQGDECHS